MGPSRSRIKGPSPGKYDRLNISGATQAFLKQNSAQRGAIKANATQTYTDANGKIKQLDESPFEFLKKYYKVLFSNVSAH